MPIAIFRHILKETSKGRFLFLLVTILIFLGVAPFLAEYVHLLLLADIFFSIILMAAIYAVSESRRQTMTALILGVPMLAALWLKIMYRSEWMMVASSVLIILFFAYIVVILLKFIFNAPRVSRNVIYASIIAYLLIGFAWGSLFTVIHHFDPRTFDISDFQIERVEAVFMYFSFVTLTTLGYGDISPLTSHAYSFAVLEAIIGQLYLTVLVARLVGLHIAYSTDRGRSENAGSKQNADGDSAQNENKDR